MDECISCSIGKAAKAARLSVKTIRYYEEIGLIPKAGRTNGGTRTGCPSRQPEYRGILQRHVRSIDERINHLLGLRAAINALISPQRQTGREKCSWDKCACVQKAKHQV
jgi:hypothetical protein